MNIERQLARAVDRVSEAKGLLALAQLACDQAYAAAFVSRLVDLYMTRDQKVHTSDRTFEQWLSTQPDGFWHSQDELSTIMGNWPQRPGLREGFVNQALREAGYWVEYDEYMEEAFIIVD